MRGSAVNKKTLLGLPMMLWSTMFVGVSLIYIIALSMLTPTQSFSGTLPFTLSNYQKLLDVKYLKVMLLSLRLAFLTTLFCLLIGYPFAYFLSKREKKTRAILLTLVIAPFWTSALIRMYGIKIFFAANGILNSFLLSLSIIDKPLKLLYTEGTVLFGMVYAMLPFVILPVYSGLERMDKSVVEASRDLYASPLRSFFSTTFLMTLPSTLAGCVLTFLPSVGLFFISDLLGGANTVLFGNLVHDALLKSRDVPFSAALSVVLLMLTMLLLFLYKKAGGKSENMVF